MVRTVRALGAAHRKCRPTARRGGFEDGGDWERCPRGVVYRTVLESSAGSPQVYGPLLILIPSRKGRVAEDGVAERRRRRAERIRKVCED